MTVNRVGIRLVVPLAAGVMVMAALATLDAQRGRGGGGGNAAEGVPVATNAIAANPGAYYGKPITVSAGLEQMLSSTAFTVDQHKAAGATEVKAVGAPLLVVAPYLNAAVDQKNYILIHGQLAKLDAVELAKIRADYKLELPPEISDKYLGQPVLIATSVRNYVFAEIGKKLPPAPTSTELSMDAVMKTIGPASAALQAAVQASKLEDVPAAVAKLQPAFTDTESMWTRMGERPAAAWAIEAREDAVAVQQAAASGDAEKAKTSAAALGQVCSSCHAIYREREDDGTFRIKASSMR
jgi:hypothetical protein